MLTIRQHWLASHVCSTKNREIQHYLKGIVITLANEIRKPDRVSTIASHWPSKSLTVVISLATPMHY